MNGRFCTISQFFAIGFLLNFEIPFQVLLLNIETLLHYVAQFTFGCISFTSVYSFILQHSNNEVDEIVFYLTFIIQLILILSVIWFISRLL